MKILEINKFYNARRGADKHFLDLIALLKNGGHQVADFSMHQDGDEYSLWQDHFLSSVGYGDSFSILKKIKGVARMFFSFEAHRKINSILDEFQPDIVHIHNIYHQMDPTILFEIKKRKIPIAMTVHDWKIINPNHSLRLNGMSYHRCADGKYYECFLDKCVKNSYLKSLLASLEMYWHHWLGTYRKNVDVFIAPSLFVKNVLVKWGMDAEKILVLPHFMPENNLRAKSNCSFSVSDSYALYAGKVSKDKGVDFLIEAFAELQGLKLYLAGEIEVGFIIPANANIVPLGFIPTEQLNEYIKNSSYVISGSELPETFGLIALEAISQGKPFIGFDNGAYGEIIINGKDGCIVKTKNEFKNCLKKIKTGELVFNKNEIIEHAKKYNAKCYLKKIETIFSRLSSKNDNDSE